MNYQKRTFSTNLLKKKYIILEQYIISCRLSITVPTPGSTVPSGAPSSTGRQASLEDIHLDQFLKTSNYEDTVKQLDIYYGIGK